MVECLNAPFHLKSLNKRVLSAISTENDPAFGDGMDWMIRKSLHICHIGFSHFQLITNCKQFIPFFRTTQYVPAPRGVSCSIRTPTISTTETYHSSFSLSQTDRICELHTITEILSSLPYQVDSSLFDISSPLLHLIYYAVK